MRLLPEALVGPAASLYSLGPGRVARFAQERIAEMVHAELPAAASLAVDVGCGPGWLAMGIARRRPEMRVVAVDLSATMVRITKHNARGLDNVEVRCENGARLSLESGSADMVVSVESMHHWRDPVAVLDEFHRVLRPGGQAWIFDGRGDFGVEDMRQWHPFARQGVPRPVLFLVRAILRSHGFSRRQWDTAVPEIARRSRFGGGRVEPIGLYGRLELVKAGP